MTSEENTAFVEEVIRELRDIARRLEERLNERDADNEGD
jgi:hypothetical protein